MGQEQSGAIAILCDKKSAISIAKNPTLHGRTKHMDIWYHFIRHLIAEGKVLLSHCGTEDQLANVFEKPLTIKKHIYIRSLLGVCDFQSRAGVEGCD